MAARNGKIAFPPRKKEKTLPFQFRSFTGLTFLQLFFVSTPDMRY